MTKVYQSGTQGGLPPNREGTRRELVLKLLWYSFVTLWISLGGTICLMALGKLEADKAVTFLLAVASVISGFLASALTHYFVSK